MKRTGTIHYDFRRIKTKIEEVRFIHAQQYYRSTDAAELKWANKVDEILGYVIHFCESEDIEMVKLFWEAYRNLL